MKHNAYLWGLFAAVIIAAVTCLSLLYASPFARTWDEVDFTLALHRFDLLAMQPHFPGYPYFILGGLLINHWINNPVIALSVFNTLAALSSVVPMFLLASRLTGSGMKSLLLPAFVLSSPYIWIMSSRPMSECAGMALLWWFLWSVRWAMDRPGSVLRHGLALLMFGFLMGTRLSFFPYGLALVPLWYSLWKNGGPESWRKWLRLGGSALAALFFQLLWVAGLVLSEGTLAGFWKLSVAFVEGHFSEWGGGVISTPMPLGERMYQLFGQNLLGSALLGHSVLIGTLLVCLVASAWFCRRFAAPGRQDHENRRYIFWLVSCAVVYTLWALIGQNIEKPRHIVPVIAPIMLLGFAYIIRTWDAVWASRSDAGTRLSQIAPAALQTLLASLLAAQVIYGAQLLKRQAVEEPAVYQLHDYVSSLQEPLLLFTWEETRVLQYLQADYDHRRIYTFGYFQALAGANPERRVLLTDHVIQGFAQQGQAVTEHVKQLAVFKSDPLFDPAYGDITLYEWVPVR